ncbi:MFS transporter [Gemmiger sp. An50]|uniref:MFS transporter n=1 Tax=Gemmiger sp. An50 TaxID=1965639 RepID=UPI000B375B06|nr:MFS transporter [Gemmiger sp. An50]OUN84102.1 MFS transporter [Gemmiger sp. An50]
MNSTEKIWNRRFILLFITNLLVLAAFYASIPIYCQEIGITGSRVGIVLTAMSVATILFRPVAGYLLDNFNRYRVYLVFLALFCLSFSAFLAFPLFGALIVVRLYMGAVYSVCGSATMTLAGDVLPAAKITEGISRFAFTVSIGMAVGPYFLVVGMLVSKLSTQKVIDAGRHRMLVYISLAVLILTMLSYLFLNSGIHLLAAGFFFGLGYGILQPLFQAFVTGTTPAPQRGVANAAYMLSYDVGIGIGSPLMGFMPESIGLPLGFALTAIAYAAGGVVYLSYVDGYYRRLRQK